MLDEMVQVNLAIEERDGRCSADIKAIEERIAQMEQAKSGEMGLAEKTELGKIETFRDHASALKRHMESTGAYLKKEVKSVQAKIEEAKDIMLREIGVKIEDAEATDAVLTA